jgi:succinate-semialdehyde dehydrogenase/glutarate-semialdehyde dehydrogenase
VTINDCVYSYGEPTAPWGGVRRSGLGRTHGALGLREMAAPKYVAAEFRRGPNLWWYPYGAEFERMMAAANRAFHARTLPARLRAHLALARFPRLWRRMGPATLLRHIDKLFS